MLTAAVRREADPKHEVARLLFFLFFLLPIRRITAPLLLLMTIAVALPVALQLREDGSLMSTNTACHRTSPFGLT